MKGLDNEDDPLEDSLGPTDLSSIPEWLHEKYHDFFDTHNANWLAPNQATDYTIDLKPNTELPYIYIYNISLAKLKALEEYLQDTIAKG